MLQKPIAIIGSVDPTRNDYNPALKNATEASGAARALGKELARANHPILVFSCNPSFVEAHIVAGYIASGKALPKSIIVLYPRDRDPNIHGDFPEQETHPDLFDLKTDAHPRWEASYYQSLPDVKGILMLGGGHATLIMGLMALASRMPIVSLACFGGNAEEIWAMAINKPWIDSEDRDAMGRSAWNDNMAETLVKSFDKQQAKLEQLAQDQVAEAARIRKDRDQRSKWATVFGISAALLTGAGIFGSPLLSKDNNGWLIMYALCFFAVPISAGIAGAMFFTLRQSRNLGHTAQPPSVKETVAHGLWAGLGSAMLFFVSQISANQNIQNLSQAVIDKARGLDILLLFSLMIGFVAGLTYEAVFGKWEAVDASRAGMIEKGL